MSMTKQQVADHLGVTIRSVEAYASKGKLTPAKAKGTRGDITVYDEKEVEALKQEREQIQYVPRPETALATAGSTGQAGIAKRRDLADFIKLIESARAAAPSFSDLAAKPLLKLEEAQTLTGLSRQTLREAIETGKLKAKVIGRAWRIKRTDLDDYLKKL
jgi:excisionase family DNA binding protein